MINLLTREKERIDDLISKLPENEIGENVDPNYYIEYKEFIFNHLLKILNAYLQHMSHQSHLNELKKDNEYKERFVPTVEAFFKSLYNACFALFSIRVIFFV